MAKVVGPLFSVDARGKVADTLVFMGWRGLKTVRRWLKPANPRTANQVITRNQFSSAVAAWHLLSPADQNAWRASAAGKAYSGFNLLVGLVKSALATDLDWLYITDVTATPGAAGSGNCVIDASCATEGTLPGVQVRYGRTMALADGLVEEVGTAAEPSITLPDLIVDSVYYFRVESQDEAADPGRTGIYSFTSPAAE